MRDQLNGKIKILSLKMSVGFKRGKITIRILTEVEINVKNN